MHVQYSTVTVNEWYKGAYEPPSNTCTGSKAHRRKVNSETGLTKVSCTVGCVRRRPMKRYKRFPAFLPHTLDARQNTTSRDGRLDAKHCTHAYYPGTLHVVPFHPISPPWAFACHLPLCLLSARPLKDCSRCESLPFSPLPPSLEPVESCTPRHDEFPNLFGRLSCCLSSGSQLPTRSFHHHRPPLLSRSSSETGGQWDP